MLYLPRLAGLWLGMRFSAPKSHPGGGRMRFQIGLLQNSTFLFKAFSDQIKAPKAPKMKNKYRFYGK
jgi:hypothetical protein